MHNKKLAHDYIVRSGKRLLAVEVLFHEKSWPDVVRECQEIVELTLKGLLIYCNVEVPRIHDVSSALDLERKLLAEPSRSNVDFFIQASKTLRRDRELAFYGSEDLTPSEFYTRQDAKTALDMAHKIHQIVSDSVPGLP